MHASYKIAKRLYEKAPEADGIFIPCPRWPTIEDVEILEHEIGKPGGDQLPSLHLVRAQTDPDQGGGGGLRAADGQPGGVSAVPALGPMKAPVVPLFSP